MDRNVSRLAKIVALLSNVSDDAEKVIHQWLQLFLRDGLSVRRRFASVRVFGFDLQREVENTVLDLFEVHLLWPLDTDRDLKSSLVLSIINERMKESEL